MKNFPPIVLLVFLFLITFKSIAQNKEIYRVMFYNLENLFDTRDDSLTTDEEFLPLGDRHWTFERFRTKLNHTSKVILACGGWTPPAVVGLCEVENLYVLEQLLMEPSFGNSHYKIIHKDSPDERGIDVGMLYDQARFRPIHYCYIPLIKGGDTIKTREILYVAGIPGNSSDTIHLFFNHWPSRYGGYLETVDLRSLAANTLRAQVDKLYSEFRKPKIIIMGDFNDQPSDESLTKVLRVTTFNSYPESDKLLNLSTGWDTKDIGTLKYQSQWQIFDQVIVSGSFLSSDKGVSCHRDSAVIFKPGFLLIKDESFGGLKPYRTFNGFNYQGGFSDHLPVYLDLTLF